MTIRSHRIDQPVIILMEMALPESGNTGWPVAQLLVTARFLLSNFRKEMMSATMVSPISDHHPITFKPLSTLFGRTLKCDFVVATSSYARSTWGKGKQQNKGSLLIFVWVLSRDFLF
nr:hypothetical protein [Tanacetum cinerariifolium]